MNATTDSPEETRASDKLSGKWSIPSLLGLGLLVCLVAITSQSYWLDEAGTAYKAGMRTISDWWACMRWEGNSNLQLPLYMLYAWVWEKLLGLDEFALRLGNAPWLLLGLGVIAKAIRVNSLRWSVCVAILCSPFVWYYLDDARPYSLQLGCSLVVLGSLVRLGATDRVDEERNWIWVLLVGATLLSAAGMLAMIWLCSFLGASLLCTSWPRVKRLARQHFPVLASMIFLQFIIGCYYCWTLSIGARASSAAGTDIKNVLFILYELTGFSGLGPGRLEIRGGDPGVFQPWIPLLSSYAALLGIVITAAVPWVVRQPRRFIICWCFGCAGVLVFLITVGVLAHFRLLARHCTPLLAAYVFILGTGLNSLFNSQSRTHRVLACCFLMMSMISCLGLRLGTRHHKDDYRGAASAALDALRQGQVVWWNADRQGALVYGVAVSGRPEPHAALLIEPSEAGLRSLPAPDLIVASKPDIYDQAGYVRAFIREKNFEVINNFTAFQVWRKREPVAQDSVLF